MPSIPIPGGRRSKRIVSKKPARLVLSLDGVQRLVPCLIVDRSQEGFRLRSNFKLKRGQLVELIVDDPVNSVQCEVKWSDKARSGQEWEAGLRCSPVNIVSASLFE